MLRGNSYLKLGETEGLAIPQRRRQRTCDVTEGEERVTLFMERQKGRGRREKKEAACEVFFPSKLKQTFENRTHDKTPGEDQLNENERKIKEERRRKKH